MGISSRVTVPYTPNDAPAGTEHTLLLQESKKLWRFIKGADNVTKQGSERKYVLSDVRGST